MFQEKGSVFSLLATFVTGVVNILAVLLLVLDALALLCEGQVAKHTVVKLMVTLVNAS